jgi:1-phosphofructokinase
MILTVTPNPSLDLLYAARNLVWDDANRIAEPRIRPGGQGINVLRALRRLGCDAEGLTLLGGPTGAELRGILQAEHTPVRVVLAGAPTRLFVAVDETGTGRTLLLNSPGPGRTADEADRFLMGLRDAIGDLRADWVACCGSLPPGFESDTYARVCGDARHAGSRCVTDCDGPALRLAAETGCDLLVPNQHEAARLLERPVPDLRAAIQAAHEIRRRYATDLVAVTLGRLGAVFSTRSEDWVAAHPVREGNVVGAGDAFLAALLLQLLKGEQAPECLRFAVAVASTVTDSVGSDLIEPTRIPSAIQATTVSRITDS